MKRWGILGRVNVSTTFAEIKDGTSNTIVTGEMQRITDDPSVPLGFSGFPVISAMTAGLSVVPRHCSAPAYKSIRSTAVPLSNNKLFMSPGSEHSGGANYGMGDGSVRYLTSSMDSDNFCLLGSMADKQAVQLDPSSPN